MALRDKYEYVLASCNRYEMVVGMAKQHDNQTVLNIYLDKIDELSKKWLILVTDLMEVLLERGYTVAVDDLNDYAQKFYNFQQYVKEEKARQV